MSDEPDIWSARLYCNEREVMRLRTLTPPSTVITSANMFVDYTVPGARLERHDHRLVPWHDVEQIAAYVRGDGTDALRQALADGILEARR